MYQNIGEKKRLTYSCRGVDVLGVDDALGLDDKEVEQLVDAAENLVEGIARQGVVLAGAELAGKTLVKDKLADNLSGHSDAEKHPSQAQPPPENIQESEGDNESNNRTIGDTSFPWRKKG